jgi:hypothetical protein
MLRPMSAMVYHQNHKELQRTQMKQVAQLKTRIASVIILFLFIGLIESL